jgi:hypothetical protein
MEYVAQQVINQLIIVMNLKIFTLTSWLLILMNLEFATAKTTSKNQPDRNGDYFRNDADVRGPVPKPTLMRGYLWRVVSPQLNCRKQPSANSTFVRQFQQGTLLQADVGGGGSDEVLINATDNMGKPWMRVRSVAGQDYGCYARANYRYLRPYQGKFPGN